MNTPILDLIKQYEDECCDFSIESSAKMALRYVETMEDSQARCLLFVLANHASEGKKARD